MKTDADKTSAADILEHADPGGAAARPGLEVGLAVGNGTGPDLAEVFEAALQALAARARLGVSVVRCPHRFRTYWDTDRDGLAAADVTRLAAADADAYGAFLRERAAAGCPAVFRTAFNAQSLYLIRERLLGVKVEHLPTGSGEILLVRDGTQGFYAGTNDAAHDPDTLVRTCSFSRERTARVLDFARRTAAARWGATARIDAFCAAYKFHLLDNRLARWVGEYAEEHGVRIDLLQPDTMNRNLLRGLYRGNVLVVGANEWADIMHADLVARHGLGTQEERCSWNAYLHPDLNGLVEYQTVHGSADDLAGRGLVNPLATLRAAAAILGRFGPCPDMPDRLERSIQRAVRARLTTPDMGGRLTTREAAEAVLAGIDAPAEPAAAAPGARPRDALVIVDMQNDFCAPGGRFACLGLIQPEAMQALAGRVDRLAGAARSAGVDVIFVRTIADEEQLPATMTARLEKTGRGGYLRSDAWGSRFFGATPLENEPAFTKLGYDVFLDPAFERHVAARGIGRLVVAGVFTDLCLDALARSAYQKGFPTAVVRDATLPLHRPQDESLAFMNAFYGTAVTDSREIMEGWTSAACPNTPTLP